MKGGMNPMYFFMDDLYYVRFFLFILLILFSVFLVFYMPVWTYKDAKKRGMSAGLWALIVFFTSLVGLVIYLAFRNPDILGDWKDYTPAPPRTVGGSIRCPHCNERIDSSYANCPHCGEKLKEDCPYCHQPLEPHWKRCAHCGEPVPDYARK